MRFPYQHYEIPASPVDGSTDLYRPEIPLHLIGESDELFLFGLLDTGADGVVIGRGVAETIGATLDENVRWTLRGLNSRSLKRSLVVSTLRSWMAKSLQPGECRLQS